MDQPDLRHFGNGWIFSDPAMALVGETWIPAVFTDRGWRTRDFAASLDAVTEWCYGEKAKSSRKENQQGDEGIQGRDTEVGSTGQRKRTSRKKS